MALESVNTTASSNSSRSTGALLDETDLDYWRKNYMNRGYASDKADFDKDYVPAYGYGTEASRKSVGVSGGSKNFTEVDTELRGGWDQSKATSSLTYDQARPAIEDAYNRTLRLHEERLRVNKERVQTGDVTLRKEVITEQKQIEVPIEREEVVITTTAITDGQPTGETISDSEVINVPVSEERVNVQKEVVPTGEVHLDKRKIQETKTVVDNLRKETVRVDKTGDVHVTEETNSGSR
ncbi:MAG TPA: YsnF/AvaK domain-containing protein [Tepidisphaeraceae bacterium]